MVIGHERIIRFLRHALERRLPIHGFLFWGPEGVGKKLVALQFAKGILCEKGEFGGCGACKSCEEFNRLAGSNRDLLVLQPTEEAPYGIETSRSVKKFLASRPQIAAFQVVVMDEADELTPQAQNALLKILEEPPEDAVLILITEKPSRLFETIRSRLVAVPFRTLAEREIAQILEKKKAPEKVRGKISRLSLGRPARAVAFAENPSLLREEEKLISRLKALPGEELAGRFLFAKEASENMEKVFPLWHLVLRDEILLGLGKNEYALTEEKSPSLSLGKAALLLRKALTASELVEDTNASPRMLLENLLLSLE